MGFCKGVEVLRRTQTYSMNQPSGCHGCKGTRMHELSLNWTADTLSLRGAERKGSGRGESLNFPPNSGRECTLCFVLSVPIFCFDFFRKFRLPNGLHRSWSISPKAGGTCQHGPDLIDLRQPLEGWFFEIFCLKIDLILTFESIVRRRLRTSRFFQANFLRLLWPLNSLRGQI